MRQVDPERGMSMSTFVPAVGADLKSVLVAYDFSEASEKPLHHALAIARHYRANFYLAHVVSSVGYTIAGPQAQHLAEDAVRREAQALHHNLERSGALTGLRPEFLVREGQVVWKQLELLIQEKQVDLVVIGTHGRHTLGKLLLGSVAEQIFRRAHCFVLTVGPGSFPESPVDSPVPKRQFLFATDFGPASMRALPHAISFANHFGARLVLLHVLPKVPLPEGFHWSSTSSDVMRIREDARLASLQQLEELMSRNGPPAIKPGFLVEFGDTSKRIMHAAETLKADVIIMGLNRSSHIETAAHMPWATAYQVACGAYCPVLTMRS